MSKNDLKIGKIAAAVVAGVAVILFLFTSVKLFTYDAQENEMMTISGGEGQFIVEDGNKGYRIYTTHENCEEVEIDIYYESYFGLNRGDLMWDGSCSAGFFEFRPAKSGDLTYLGTVFYQGPFDTKPTSEVEVDFNVSSTHEIIITDREPVEQNLDFRTLSLILLGIAGSIYGVTKRTEIKRGFEKLHEQAMINLQERLNAPENIAALKAVEMMESHLKTNNIDSASMFSSFDLNKDGSINHFELMEGLKKIGVEGLTPLDIDALVSILDSDGDGKIQLIELQTILDQHQ